LKKLLITIDGPAGAGKTTLSRLLAARLGYRYVDTGALYRGIAVEVKKSGIFQEEDQELERLLKNLTIQFVRKDDAVRLLANGIDITDQLRSSEITMLASSVSARPVVREYLLKIQRKMGAEKSAVFEGRDMGTVVFPHADIKFYLDAASKTRALRRYNENKNRIAQSLEEVQSDMQRRDEDDSKRELAPLKPADDAVIIDTTNLSIQEVVDQMMAHIKKLHP
jgi:cytidylate kinase